MSGKYGRPIEYDHISVQQITALQPNVFLIAKKFAKKFVPEIPILVNASNPSTRCHWTKTKFILVHVRENNIHQNTIKKYSLNYARAGSLNTDVHITQLYINSVVALHNTWFAISRVLNSLVACIVQEYANHVHTIHACKFVLTYAFRYCLVS